MNFEQSEFIEVSFDPMVGQRAAVASVPARCCLSRSSSLVRAASRPSSVRLPPALSYQSDANEAITHNMEGRGYGISQEEELGARHAHDRRAEGGNRACRLGQGYVADPVGTPEPPFCRPEESRGGDGDQAVRPDLYGVQGCARPRYAPRGPGAFRREAGLGMARFTPPTALLGMLGGVDRGFRGWGSESP